MRKQIIKINSFIKGIVLFLRPGAFLNFLSNPFIFFANTLRLTQWIYQQPRENILNDFYHPFRDYNKRYKLYDYVLQKENILFEPIIYLEFGVSSGLSFSWWLNANKNDNSRFYGFDTFEGLPEDWGFFKKGDMFSSIPILKDPRTEFIKGLFQETLFEFFKTHNLDDGKKIVVHLDADLFSSALFVLTSMAKYLKEGDIIFFDEFNVPNHEFYAFKCFSDSFYIKTKLIGSVNNYLQVALKVVK
ncbi:MAG: class I SAM-dependent methyltransferase [Bacteroidota bacterium]